MNLILGGAILWATSKLFPAIVQIADFKTLVIALVLLSITTVVIGLLCLGGIAIGLLAGDIGSVVIGMIAILFANVIAMYIISACLDGFNIVGFWPKVILAICFSTFQVNLTNTNRNQ
ncbi:phage holin family protein [Candidatus Saccharibacteria bacterium]|nr:phage holin family protein [Candidatus Saccharibacteria bacterium]